GVQSNSPSATAASDYRCRTSKECRNGRRLPIHRKTSAAPSPQTSAPPLTPLTLGEGESKMQRHPQRLQSGLVKSLALGRVGVDREGHVLQPRAHLDRQREGRAELRDARADGLNAEHDVVVLARHDADKALVILLRH